MAEDQWIWRALLVVLLLAAAAFVFPVMAQDETSATPPSPPPLNETLTWTLPPTPDEVAEETPEETAEEDPNETQEMTPEETEDETPSETGVITEEETSEEVLDETVVQIAPGDTLQVTEDVQVYDLSALRNETASGDTAGAAPIIELQAYEDDDLETGSLTSEVSLGASDTGVELDASDFNGIYGTYYPYDGEAVIDKPITVEGPSGGNGTANTTEPVSTDGGVDDTPGSSDTSTVNETMNETLVTETEPPAATGGDEVMTETTPADAGRVEMPTFTPLVAAEVETSPTQAAPISLLGVIVALTVAGLLIVMRRR